MHTPPLCRSLLFQLATALVVGGAFGLLAWAGIALTREEGRIAVIWLPNAFLIAVLLRSQLGRPSFYLPFAFVGNMLANIAVGDNYLSALPLALTNNLEVSIIWITMRWLKIPRPDMRILRDLIAFCCIGGLIAPLVSGFFAALILNEGGWASAFGLWLKSTMSNGLGILLLTPMILVFHDMWKSWKQNNLGNSKDVSTRSFVEWITILLIGLVTSVAIFGQSQLPLLFMVMPVILLHAFRLGTLGTSIATLQIAVVGFIFTAMDMGPIHLFEATLSQQLFTLQLFLFCCFSSGLPVSALLAAKDKIREQLKDSITQNKLIAHAAPVGIFQADLEGKLYYVNDTLSEMTGMTAEHLLEDGAMASLNKPAPWDGSNIEETGYTGLPRKLQIPFSKTGGSKIWLETLDVPKIDQKEKLSGYTGVVIDITESKELEQNLISARRDAEAAAESKSRFLANMSHEIRTPMNGVLGFTQLLLDSDLTTKQRQHMEMIMDSGNAMMRLLNNILDLSKIEAGQVSTDPEPVDISHVLHSCTRLVAPSVDQKGLTLSVQIDDWVPEKIMGDGHRLRQIILNLLGNAIKFTDFGGIILRASIKNAEGDEPTIIINVEDTGIGIAAERQKAIFSPFEQASNDTAKQYGGSGLGLAISQQLADLMNGDLSVTSARNEGTTFTLRIPGQAVGGKIKKKIKGTRPKLPNAVLPNLPDTKNDPPPASHLLLAEDHDINQVLITAMIKRLGHEITLAKDGAEAVTKVDEAIAAGKPFDLVLMDIQMPIIDGYQATRMIRSNGVSANDLPIVAITANAFENDIDSCVETGMQAHVSKPVMISRLKAVLDEWLPANDDKDKDKDKDKEANSSSHCAHQYLNEDLLHKYQRHKDDILLCLNNLVHSATYSEEELRVAADHLHKLAGTAAMFGEPNLGIKAKQIEVGITSWKVEDLPKHLEVAVSDFLRAA